jgi:2-polyprenyl-6-hydroxyphenyl methylase/3-demethylubiquinone-9 3-methyltransferase
MRQWASAAGLEFQAVSSLMYNPVTRNFRTASGREDVNYMAWFRKAG